PILDRAGHELGEHRGIVYYTIGQRRGLGLNADRPLFVTAIDPQRNAVIVGEERDLYADGLVADQVNWIAIEDPLVRGESTQDGHNGIECSFKIRSRAPEVAGVLESLPDGRARVRFAEPQKSVTPGQAIV